MSRWQDKWHVDMSYGTLDEEIDGDGWTYGKRVELI